MKTELELRWKTDPRFKEMRRLLLNPDASPQFAREMSRREWFKTETIWTKNYATEEDSIDCRGLFFNDVEIGKISLYVLDYSSAIHTTFDRTGFQGASLKGCDMRGSRFIAAQMSPIYAYQANFENCEFERCFLMGTSPRNHTDPWGVPVKAPFSDLRHCNFKEVKAYKTAFERCDFRGANLSRAHFKECTFTSSDLTQVTLQDARFEGCDFDRAWLNDTPKIRSLIGSGDNLNINTVTWKCR